MDILKKSLKIVVFSSLFFLSLTLFASPHIELTRLQEGYPELIQSVSDKDISWKDGTHTNISDSHSLLNKLANIFHSPSPLSKTLSIKDFQCDTYEPFFRKMYGSTAVEVKKKLVTIYWLPKIFGNRYPLRVTTVNGIDKKLQRISAALEKLPLSDMKYLDNPGGSFYWRNVDRESYLSAHSFGMAIDINSHYGNYWLWDFKKSKKPYFTFEHINKIPQEIIHIFEQEGFLWGGHWAFYDTMHFEYRPELFTKNAENKLEYNHQLGLRCT